MFAIDKKTKNTRKYMKLNKINQKGIAHLLAITGVIVLTALAGTYFLVASHADTPSVATPKSEPVASAASKRFSCPGKMKPVSATPKEFMDSNNPLSKSAWTSLNSTGYGIICVKSSAGHKVSYTPNNRTITHIATCDNNKQFAFDSNNRDGTGYDKADWVVQTYSYGKKTTLYCVAPGDLRSSHQQGLFGHTYVMVHVVDLSKGCNAKEKKFGGCSYNWFFSYAGSRDVYKTNKTYTVN